MISAIKIKAYQKIGIKIECQIYVSSLQRKLGPIFDPGSFHKIFVVCVIGQYYLIKVCWWWFRWYPLIILLAVSLRDSLISKHVGNLNGIQMFQSCKTGSSFAPKPPRLVLKGERKKQSFGLVIIVMHFFFSSQSMHLMTFKWKSKLTIYLASSNFFCWHGNILPLHNVFEKDTVGPS